ncbi:MAG: oxygen-independent coproporphyrinogen III oxidase [Rhodospirillales bacterium]|nr:oxygen-independent coproporphyrinogen III oxidase [Rhodospirillales bacterium]
MHIEALIEKYDGTAPRYTSYPTANHFSDAVTPADYEGWLAGIAADQAVSLYLHIPFCKTMCTYCGCHTKIIPNYDPAADYVETMLREIDLVADRLGRRQPVSHIQWGGGTPTFLSTDDLSRLFEKLRARFDVRENAEIGMEIDPRTIDQAKIEAMAALGVNRISFGVQDFDADVQEVINRVQPYEQVKEVTAWARAAGIDDVNFDLMYGLPLQTEETIRRTMEQAASLNPKRLAVFGYAHVPWFAKHQEKLEQYPMPNPVERYHQFMILTNALESHGYHPIGIDHFAKSDDPMFKAVNEGTLHRNFQGYTTDTADIMLSFGATAIGQLPQGFVQNTPLLKKYREMVWAGTLPIVRGIAVNKDDITRRGIVEHMMCHFETDYGVLTAAEQQEIAAKLAVFEQDGMIVREGTKVRINAEAKIFTRLICTAFDSYFVPAAQKHAKAV